jgi:PAP2 superfamily
LLKHFDGAGDPAKPEHYPNDIGLSKRRRLCFGGTRAMTRAAVAESVRQILEFPASATLVVALYALARVSSICLNVDAELLNLIPLCIAFGIVGSVAMHIFFHGANCLRQGLTVGCMIIVLVLCVACLSYLGAMTDLPLRDSEIIWLDKALGFEWLHVMEVLDHFPEALRILGAAYATFTPQLVGISLVLLIFRRTRDLDRFLVTFLCAAILAEAASVLAPTLGPMATLGKNIAFVNLPHIGRGTADIIMDLREGVLRTISLTSLDGIISFPSLHAAVAAIVPFTCRWNWPLELGAVLPDPHTGRYYVHLGRSKWKPLSHRRSRRTCDCVACCCMWLLYRKMAEPTGHFVS